MRIILLSLLSVLLNVHNQSEFDALPARLDSVLNLAPPPELVEVRIGPGVFFYGERHLDLNWLDLPGTRIVLTGDNCTLVAKDNGSGYDLKYNYVDLNTLEGEDSWTEVKKAGSWPVPVIFKKGVYKIRCKEPDLSEEEAKDLWLHISQWFRGPFYPVVRIRNGWLYFRKDADYETSLWSELRFGRCLPRYLLCNKPQRADLHACTNTTFLSLSNSRLASFSMSDLSFLGNADGQYLIWLDGLQADSVVVAKSRFSHLRSSCIKIDRTDGFHLEDCLFTGNYQGCVIVAQDCRFTSITGNRFIGNGRMMTNMPLIRCSGEEFRIADNYFEDFSYSALGLGVHYTETDTYGTTGVVERNEICQSEAFRRHPMRSLIDAGAIYIATGNKRTVIRDNYIHDIDGPHGNRGIFADDGAMNVTIENNTVLRIRNSHCIDLRKCYRVKWLPDSKVSTPNTGNIVRDNVYDGKIRLFARKNDPTSFFVNNRRVCE